jgi:SAM-dependent methyltransferase
VTKVFSDVMSGARDVRPGLADLLAYVWEGDTVVVWKFERLGRNALHILETVKALTERSRPPPLRQPPNSTTSSLGDIEVIDLPWSPATFDALIMSEVLEHLRDPWETLRKLQPLLKPGGRVFASSPNVANQRILRMLIDGRWRLDDSGPMDATHLQWFTPSTYAAMFATCSFVVDSVGPVVLRRGNSGSQQRLRADRTCCGRRSICVPTFPTRRCSSPTNQTRGACHASLGRSASLRVLTGDG